MLNRLGNQIQFIMNTQNIPQNGASNSIYNEYSDYGSDYSNASVFNEYASDPPKIINEDNEEIGLLSVGPDWDDERKHPEDIKYTCDWD